MLSAEEKVPRDHLSSKMNVQECEVGLEWEGGAIGLSILVGWKVFKIFITSFHK